MGVEILECLSSHLLSNLFLKVEIACSSYVGDMEFLSVIAHSVVENSICYQWKVEYYSIWSRYHVLFAYILEDFSLLKLYVVLDTGNLLHWENFVEVVTELKLEVLLELPAVGKISRALKNSTLKRPAMFPKQMELGGEDAIIEQFCEVEKLLASKTLSQDTQSWVAVPTICIHDFIIKFKMSKDLIDSKTILKFWSYSKYMVIAGAFKCQEAGWDPKEQIFKGYSKGYRSLLVIVHALDIDWDQRKEAILCTGATGGEETMFKFLRCSFDLGGIILLTTYGEEISWLNMLVPDNGLSVESSNTAHEIFCEQEGDIDSSYVAIRKDNSESILCGQNNQFSNGFREHNPETLNWLTDLIKGDGCYCTKYVSRHSHISRAAQLVLIHNDLVRANIGESRAFINIGTMREHGILDVHQLSTDHKPEVPMEANLVGEKYNIGTFIWQNLSDAAVKIGIRLVRKWEICIDAQGENVAEIIALFKVLRFVFDPGGIMLLTARSSYIDRQLKSSLRFSFPFFFLFCYL